MKTTKMTAVLLALAILTGAAVAAEEKKGDEIDQRILELQGMLKSRTPDIEAMVAAVKELGKQGPAAQKAVPVLLDCVGRMGPVKEATSGPIKDAAAEALLKMGPAAIGPTVATIEAALADAMTMKQGILNPNALSYIKLLRKMDAAFKGNRVLSALEAAMDERAKASQQAAIEVEKAAPWSQELKNATAAKEKAYFQWQMLVDATAMLGDKAIPSLTKALSQDFHEDILALKIGPAASQAAGRMLERHEEDGREWEFYYSLALAVKPDNGLCKPLIDRMAKGELGMVNYIGMVLDRMTPASIQPVAAMLADKEGDWYGRWAAAKVLEQMGPKAKEAVPALEKTLADETEDIDVRVAAARAIARIMGTDPFERYQQIPDVEKQILETSKDKSLAWRQAFMKRKAAESGGRRPAAWINWWVYCLCSGQYLDAANADMKSKAEVGPGAIGRFMDVNWVRVFVTCHSKSTFPYAGRLTPDAESALKKYFFDSCDNPIGFAYSTKDLVPGKAFAMGANHNIPMNLTTRDYLSLGVLKDDPAYKDRTFKVGDTVTQRYNAFNEYFKEFLKDWALHGLWLELGSSGYEYRTYPSYLNLAELAPDPVVRQRARMYLDLALIEAEQITISNQRGGSKSRAKQGGLGSQFNPYRPMLYGERGSIVAHAVIAASQYQPPDAAVLLHKFGAPVRNFEIANRHAGEYTKRLGYVKLSHAINYAYRTPEYVMGAATFDPNLEYALGTLGRWSGVIFRDLSAISMDGYTGEKWSVQDKDVMIAQRALGHGYPGCAKVVFESGFEKAEKGGWVFVDNGEAFAAVKVVTGGTFWGEPIKRSLYLEDQLSPIIIQTGMLKDYGSFEKFQQAILKAPLKVADNRVEYTGPNSAKLEFFPRTLEVHKAVAEKQRAYAEVFRDFQRKEGAKARAELWKDMSAKAEAQAKTKEEAKTLVAEAKKAHWREIVSKADEIAKKALDAQGIKEPDRGYILPKINGKTLDFDLKYNYRSPYMESKVGSEIVTVRYGQRRWDYDFGKNTITEIKK